MRIGPCGPATRREPCVRGRRLPRNRRKRKRKRPTMANSFPRPRHPAGCIIAGDPGTGANLMPGYSGTPLVKKLGIKDGWRIGVIGCPVGYRDLIPGMPAAVAIEDADGDEFEMIHLFATERRVLQKRLPVLLKKIRQDGM